MKKLVFPVLLMAFALISFKSLESTTYKAVVADSKITWLGASPTKTHDGTLSISEGTLVFEDNKLVGGDFIIDMNSIKVLDVKFGPANKRLTKHLKSDDFFETKKYPTGKFQITNSEAKDGKTLVKGNLTIRGITKEVSFLADVSSDGNSASLKSESFKIDRTKWDIKYRSGSFFDNLKNKMIEDKITISATIKAKK